MQLYDKSLKKKSITVHKAHFSGLVLTYAGVVTDYFWGVGNLHSIVWLVVSDHRWCGQIHFSQVIDGYC